MKKEVFIFFVVNVLAYVLAAPADAEETVWLKDTTTQFKRTPSDLGLANELTYHLMRGSNSLTLHLKRNHEIDPNADIYVVRKFRNGRSVLEKAHNLENEDVAYYQDIANGAFMTVRCVKRSDGPCERVINGNIRMGDRDYDLRPAETDISSRNFLDVSALRGKRYVLKDQANIQREYLVKNQDAANRNENNVEHELIDNFRRFAQRRDDKIHLSLPDPILSSRNTIGLHKTWIPVKKDNTPNNYNVAVAVLIDPELWDLFWSLEKLSNHRPKEDEVKRNIRQFYSHIFNGVNLRYQGIEDTSLNISVTLRHFVMFQRESDFPYTESEVKIVNGTKRIDMSKYLDDIYEWDIMSSYQLPEYDHAMLFTKLDLYSHEPKNNGARGLSWKGGVCGMGLRTSVVEAGDYFMTVSTATHELGHNLGAVHDGEEEAKGCKSDDLFIMTGMPIEFTPGKGYCRNPWLFSSCSVTAFKNTLLDRECVHTMSDVYNQTEWTKFTEQLPGEMYSLNAQCQFIMGPNSTYCGGVAADICLFMQCTDPKTGQCPDKFFGAARGTECENNMWCMEGRCVPK